MKDLKNAENLYEYILKLSTYDINKMVENAKSDNEKKLYLKLEEWKTQLLQQKLITKGVF